MEELKIGLVTSGRGTLLRYILSACFDGVLNGSVVAVAANRQCPALDVAAKAGIRHVSWHEIADYVDRRARDADMAAGLRRAGADFVLVGGYTEVLEDSFLREFPDRAISVYPALLPAFGELDEAIGPALEYGVKSVGLTIHFRDPLSLSDGAIITQFPLPVDETDSVETVAAGIAALERQHLPRVMQAFAEGRVVRDGRRVKLLPAGGVR
jgi:phosphoribosylglycinamide formyltransferase-1